VDAAASVARRRLVYRQIVHRRVGRVRIRVMYPYRDA